MPEEIQVEKTKSEGWNPITWVNTPLRNSQEQGDFDLVFAYLRREYGIQHKTDVIRHLLREKAREIQPAR